ncbi:MAG TPA: hypothetical protein VH682_12390 [Gemmataceae bacterium]|jgi:hypothetical protein
MKTGLPSRGFGDTVAQITSWFGIQPCGGCERRQELLNRWLPYRSVPAIEVPAPEVLVRPARPVAGPTIEISHELPLRPLLASSGGWRGPDRRTGPLDWEGDRRQRRSTGPNPGPQPGTTAKPTTFVCGVDVSEGIRAALRLARSEFARLDDQKKHEACSALSSLRTGGYAWDIIDLHRQVTDDTLNKPFRPPCATSGATPACGSSVTVDSSCHFAGSANYAVFGVMCKLCSDYYRDMLAKSSWYEIFDKDTYQRSMMQFSKVGMLGLIDLYKKYIPLLKFDSPAGNIDAAKRWSIAGYDGWPASAVTPPADRANCAVTCPHQARGFRVSWYPFLNPYSR